MEAGAEARPKSATPRSLYAYLSSVGFASRILVLSRRQCSSFGFRYWSDPSHILCNPSRRSDGRWHRKIEYSAVHDTHGAAIRFDGTCARGSGTVTVSAGQTATFLLQASDGGNGYTGTASFSCSGAPLGATCTVAPSSVSTSTTPSPFKVVVTTTGASSASLQTRGRLLAWALRILDTHAVQE